MSRLTSLVGIYLTLQNKYLYYKLMVDTLYSVISIWSLVSINGSNVSFVKPSRPTRVSSSGWPMGRFCPSRSCVCHQLRSSFVAFRLMRTLCFNSTEEEDGIYSQGSKDFKKWRVSYQDSRGDLLIFILIIFLRSEH